LYQFILHALIFQKSENISKVQLASLLSGLHNCVRSSQARAGIFCNTAKSFIFFFKMLFQV